MKITSELVGFNRAGRAISLVDPLVCGAARAGRGERRWRKGERMRGQEGRRGGRKEERRGEEDEKGKGRRGENETGGEEQEGTRVSGVKNKGREGRCII
ncbi:hypothetical protein E2C01_084449 [Portunus trituberculatus]|uniref:Uncharacterized protein n=1 Tax=Portunus trituberculatus TaxID=210409 RepID=A0A5B7J9A1_PORTR|nr:hypothetical protein [Portunus trituberculatus]